MADVEFLNCLSEEEEQKWLEIHDMESWKSDLFACHVFPLSIFAILLVFSRE